MQRERLTTSEAIEAAYNDALMLAAIIAYNQARVGKPTCEDCCFAIADAIRGMMKEQR